MIVEYKVTIGIPVYKALGYIGDAMNSALNQTFPDIEFLIIDDCGNDGTMDVILEYIYSHPRGKDIRILHNNNNRGVSFCRNLIIDEAKGKYLYFMDSDDVIETNAIERLYNAVEKRKAQIAYGSYDIKNIDNVSRVEVYEKEPLFLESPDELAMYAFKEIKVFHVSVCNCLIDLMFLRNSNVRFLNFSYWEDMAFTTELVTLVNRAVLLPDITYHYLRHSGSLSHYQNRMVLDKNEIIRNKTVLDYIKKKCPSLREKKYLPFLCLNLEVNSFYLVCYIIKHMGGIVPKFRNDELRDIMSYPVNFYVLMQFREKLLSNFSFWLLAHIPLFLFYPLVFIIGKIKRVL